MKHSPLRTPSFARRQAGQKALIAIETRALLRGRLSPRAELIEDWNLARHAAQLNPIAEFVKNFETPAGIFY